MKKQIFFQLKNKFALSVLALFTVSCSEFDDNIDKSSAAVNDQLSFEDARKENFPIENEDTEHLPSFIKVSNSCKIHLVKVLNRKKTGWSWSLTAHSSSVDDNFGENNCSKNENVPAEQIFDFLEGHLRLSKKSPPYSISRLTIKLQFTPQLKNAVAQKIFGLARENPNRKIYYNEVDTEYLRPHIQTIIDNSKFTENICELFAVHEMNCGEKSGQSLFFKAGFQKFDQLLNDENAGLASWSEVFFEFE